MKKFLGMFLIILLFVSIFSSYFVNADSSTAFCGDFGYVLINNTATIVKCNTEEEVLTIPETLDNYTVTAIEKEAFLNCRDTEKIIFPSNILSIGASAFWGCTDLCEVSLNNGLKSIGECAFSNCIHLKSISIPTTVEYLGDMVFYNNDELTDINVSSDNLNFLSLNGVLYDKNKTNLLCYPKGKTESDYTVPSTVTTISKDAFSGNTSLSDIYLPNSVTTIREKAFAECEGIVSISIPASAKNINDDIFEDCSQLAQIKGYYNTPIRKIAGNKFCCLSLKYDANGDGYVESTDMVFLKKYLIGINDITPSPDADSNNDGAIDIRDLVDIKKFLAFNIN